MTNTITWIGVDCHTCNSQISAINHEEGKLIFAKKVSTSKKAIEETIKQIPGSIKKVATEESAVTRWVSWIIRPLVNDLIVSEPSHNKSISRSHQKNDRKDAEQLARLYRLGELKEVWQPATPEMAILRDNARMYDSSVQFHTAIKLRIKGMYHRWGIFPQGISVFHKTGREVWLAKIPETLVNTQISAQYALLDAALVRTKTALKLLMLAGEKFPEIRMLTSFPGVGIVGAHIFAGLILDGSRFTHDSALFRYCKLGIKEKTSNDKPLGFQTLDPAGNSLLKQVSYRAWLYAVRQRNGVVYDFYRASLRRTSGNEAHARLNTQRKVLSVLWRMWLNKAPFDPEKFSRKSASTDIKQHAA